MSLDHCLYVSWRHVSLVVTVLAVMIPASIALGADSDNGYVTLFYDDFDTKDPYWDWWSVGPVGTCSHTLRDGYLFLNITDRSTSEQWTIPLISDFTTDDGTLREKQWLHSSMELRLRYIDDKLEGDIDSWGVWGFIDGFAHYAVTKHGLCFMNNPPPPQGSEGLDTGLWADAVVGDESVLMEPVTRIDTRQWHTYTILWKEDNATFLVDGDIVATTSRTPPYRLGVWIALANGFLEANNSAGRTDLANNASIQIDYVHVYIDKKRFEENTQEISELSSRAIELIDTIENKGMDTQEIRLRYATAQDHWEGKHQVYGYATAKTYLEQIVAPLEAALEHWDEVVHMFSQANTTIGEAEQLGADTRTINLMKGYYTQAETKWRQYDTENTKTYLQKILDMPEPPLLPLLSFLGLTLLPAHLLRRG